MRRIWLGCALAVPARAGQPEIELVERYLRSEAVAARVEAGRARVEGASAGPAVLPNPELLARHENAPGAATVTSVVGAGIDLDLGLSALSERSAAREAGAAAEALRTVELLDEVCAFRSELIEAWAADGHARVVATAQERVEALAADLTGLAEAGEVAAYDRDRASLAASTHRVSLDTARGDAGAALAQLEAHVGGIDGVDLLPLPPLPDLATFEASAHPRMAAALARVRSATAARAAARRTTWPAVSVSAGLRSDTTTGLEPQQGFELGGTLQVPLWDWSRPERMAAHAQVSAARADSATVERDVLGGIAAAHARAAAFEGPPRPGVDAGAVWRAASALYLAGEETIGTLLAAASDVEAAEIAAIERERRQRHARLDLDCATGRLAPPELQVALEETLR
jgi:outer membrane protein TolC